MEEKKRRLRRGRWLSAPVAAIAALALAGPTSVQTPPTIVVQNGLTQPLFSSRT
jgi:hypothetical protein